MEDALLRDKRVACTGRFASLTRTQFAELVVRLGGTFSASVAKDTTDLVIGQEGWPVLKSGQLSRKLRKAQELGNVRIIAEEKFLTELGIESTEQVRRRYSMPELCQLLDVRRDRIRAWVRAKLIEPVEIRQGVWFFDYAQISGVRNLCELIEDGVSVDRLRRSLTELRTWFADVEQPLNQLLAQDGQLLVRIGEQIADSSGQLQFDFEFDNAASQSVPLNSSRTAGDWFQAAYEHEQAERFEEAIDGYRQALLAGGTDLQISFNLANVLAAAGHKEQAAERYWQVLEQDSQNVDAWCNLGVALHEIGQTDQAVAALERCLQLDPNYAAAHYNLADLLDEANSPAKARPHWQQYLRWEPTGPWADYARARLFAG